MPNIREQREILERQILSPLATRAENSLGRERAETPCPIRTCFRRDIDRIVHSKAYKYLKDKTQVFIAPEDDAFRTRITHTTEVARVAVTIAGALRLNEDLTEAIALGHDLGHTPFGHAGESVLNEIMQSFGGNFKHNEQSLRVVDTLEKNGRGLNLTWEVRDGILNHTSKGNPTTAEGQVVSLSDRIAYLCHDTDDAVRAGLITVDDLPQIVKDAVSTDYSQRLNVIITDLIATSQKNGKIGYSPEMNEIVTIYREFMFESVYRRPSIEKESIKVRGIINSLFEHYYKFPEDMSAEYIGFLERDARERVVADYISGMSDRRAMAEIRIES